MKKMRLILVVCGLLLTIISSGQTTLTFRLANPNVVNMSGTDYFAFDVQVKAAVAGSYLFSGQAVLSFANANLDNTSGWAADKGPLLTGSFTPGTNQKYADPLIALTGSPVKVSIAWTSNSGSVGSPASSVRFNEITTAYQTLVIVYAPITNAAGLAGIDFDEASMNGQQSYKLNALPWYAYYTSPNLYDAADFMNTYMGRIYANGAWSQVGGVPDWSVSVNTSVWNGNATVAGGPEAKAAAVRLHGSATLTIPVNGKLTVAGATEINAAGGLTLLSDATGTGSFISGTVTGPGTAVAKRYVIASPTAWHLVASPVGGQSINDFVTSVDNNIAYSGGKFGLAPYDNTIPGWLHYTPASLAGAGNFGVGQGYEVLRSSPDGLLSFTGTVSTGTIPYVITNTGANLWWNLLGNPYPSAINANAGAGAANFLTANLPLLAVDKSAVYVWNQPNGTYDAYNQASPAAFIPVGQAFFVKAVSGGGAVDFTAAMRTHSSAAFKAGQSGNPSINVKATIAGKNRNAQIYYIAGTTTGVDQGYDAGTFEENNPAIALSSRIEGSDVDFAIQSLPDTNFESVIALGLNAPQGSVVSFTAEVTDLPAGSKVYLEDRLTGKFTQLDKTGGFYTVEMSSVAQGAGRFFIHTTQGTLGVIDEVMSEVSAIALPREHRIRILGIDTPDAVATIYEMNGAVAGTKVLPNVGENEMPFMPLSNGVYMLTIQQTGKTPTSVKINWIY